MASFQIFQDPDNVKDKKQNVRNNKNSKENVYKGKPEPNRVLVGNKQRIALSAIASNNVSRLQPTRTAKQKTAEISCSHWPQDENLPLQPKNFQASKPLCGFGERSSVTAIDNSRQSDREETVDSSAEEKNQLELNSTVTMLQKSDSDQMSLQTDTVEDSDDNVIVVEDSPMILDQSIEYRRTRDRRRTASVALYVPEYARDIHNYLRDVEMRHHPKPLYMRKQPDITHAMRAVLVDWLVEVAEEYKLQTESLYLAVSYIDRFLSSMSVLRGKLQLVGTAAMFIASKYEEIYPPDVSEFVYITDDTYTKKQVLRMEHLILKVLSFDLAVPTSFWFIDRYCDICSARESTKHLAKYLSELTLLDGESFLRFYPSMIAASSIALANHTVGADVWGQELEEETGYALKDLHECYSAIQKIFQEASSLPQRAIKDKYKSSKYGGVSQLTPLRTLPW